MILKEGNIKDKEKITKITFENKALNLADFTWRLVFGVWLLIEWNS